MKPVLRHIANLWTLLGHPTSINEWTLNEKLDAIQSAGFDGVCWAGSPELAASLEQRGLIFVGGMTSADRSALAGLLEELQGFGAHHINVQLGADSALTPEAMMLTETLMAESQRLSLEAAIESHRGTCTETPEKLYALADAYQASTGDLLPISWDFSHFAVVKHLVASNFSERLLVRPDLVQRAQQFHFRPFNGHHAQVPVTDRDGALTQETKDWLPFAEAILRIWLDANGNSNREIFICPELGPLEGGYALSTFSNSWEDAKLLRLEIDRLWQKVNT